MGPTLPRPNPTPPPPPPHSSSSYNSFPILAISILGILTTAILLVSYYVFVIKCCINWRRSDLLLLRLSRSRSRRHHPNPPPFPYSPDSRGLDPSAIRSIPTFRFTKSTRNSVECAVCLTDFQEEELLRLLPNCSHAFHIDCIDTWLQSRANCPSCRSDITLTPIHHFALRPSEQDSNVVIDVRDIRGSDQTPIRLTPKSSKGRKFWHVASMGDEWIDTRKKDDRFVVQPIRRSFSMDSSNDRQLYASVQEILQQNPNLFRDVGSREGSSSGGGGSGRVRRSFLSFGRSSRSAILPIQSELL